MSPGQFSLRQPPQTILFLHGGSSVTTAGMWKGYWKRHVLTCYFTISENQQVKPSNDSISVSPTLSSSQDFCFTMLAQKTPGRIGSTANYHLFHFNYHFKLQSENHSQKIAIMTFTKDFTFHPISHQILYLFELEGLG